MAMPGSTNAMTPSGTNVPPGGEHVSRMQKNQADIVASHMPARSKDSRARSRPCRASGKCAYERDLTVLLGMGYQFDLAKTVERCSKMDDAGFEDFKVLVKENYSRRAGHSGDDMVRTWAAPLPPRPPRTTTTGR